jgi:hypothetical protein
LSPPSGEGTGSGDLELLEEVEYVTDGLDLA